MDGTISFTMPEAVVAIILALFVCFFGYKLKKIALAVIWFIVGYSLGKTLPIGSLFPDPFWIQIIPIVLGILGAIISVSVERLCVALLAGAIGFFMTISFLGNSYQFMPNVVIAVIVGVILACIAVAAIKPMTVFITAVGGAYYVATNAIALGAPYAPWFYVIVITLSILGVLFQLKNNKGLA